MRFGLVSEHRLPKLSGTDCLPPDAAGPVRTSSAGRALPIPAQDRRPAREAFQAA